MTKYVGLIGYPVGHSVSPQMQQAAFDRYGLDVRYELWETEPDALGAFVERLRHPDYLGANVTVPHKAAMMNLVDDIEPLAYEVGAVNTISNRDGRLTGYNTDAGGFLKALKEDGAFDPVGKDAVILGAGGAARAATFALSKAGIKSLVITDIELERARKLKGDLERSLARTQGKPPRSCYDAKDVTWIDSLTYKMWPIPDIEVLPNDAPKFKEAISACRLIVNCTPIGMKHSATEGKSPLDAILIPNGALVFDVVYNPMETRLLADAKNAGACTLNGLAMLVYQGAIAFELWTGKEAPVNIMYQAAKDAL
ncbi:MAG: shikimate dehydrogenase [Chloroflexota bacterium]|nr:shikimate dehydrogenase [Chloroflexota bacterium]